MTISKTQLKITSCRIKENTKKKIQFTQSAIKINEELSNNNKSKNYSEDEVINKSLDKLLESMDIKMEENIEERDIIIMEGILSRNRVDNNFKPKNKRILKSLSEAMFDEGMIKEKLTYDEIITILIENYLEHFPKLKKYTFIEQNINQQYRTKEMIEKRKGYTNV